MTYALRHYQQVAAEFLAERKGALLADAPRVGKTAAAIRACDIVHATNVLWVTTGSARADHARAWKRFQNNVMDREINVVYSGRDRISSGVTIISYDLLRAHRDEICDKDWNWDALVLDEVHKLKTRDTKRTEAVFGLKCEGGPDSLVAHAEHVWGLSGTPAPNNYSELWPFLRACLPDAILKATGKPMGYWDFTERFCIQRDDGFGLKIVGNRNSAELRERLAPYQLRRTLADIAPEVPMVTTDVLRLGNMMDVRAVKRIEQDAALAELSEALAGLEPEVAQKIIEHTMKRVDARIPRLTGMAKVQPIIDHLLEEQPDKLVIFCWHTDVIDRLYRDLGGDRTAVVLDGSVTGANRGKIVERFQTDPGCRFFIGQIVAAGEAIDLSVADEVLFAESSWVPGHNEQAAMRVVNVNKTRPTLARFATIPGSIDEKVQSAASAKLADIQKLFK